MKWFPSKYPSAFVWIPLLNCVNFLCPQVPRSVPRASMPFESPAPLSDLKEALALLLDFGFQGLNVDFAPIPALHPAARHALGSSVVAPSGASVFHVFTDGSSGHNGATWAFVVLAEIRVGSEVFFFRVGYAGGWVDSSIGRCLDDALDAEATALAAVSEYLLSRPIAANLQIHVHFDSQAAGFGTVGSHNVARSDSLDSDRTVAARVLMGLVQQRFQSVVGYHIHAHQSHPWNEMADSIASCIRHGWDPPVPFVWRSGPLLAHPLRDWAWLDLHSGSDLPSLDHLLLNPPPVPRHRPGDPALRTASMDPSSAVTACLRIVTVNVGTLNAAESELPTSISGRAHALLMQCSDLNLDIIAVQESRARHSCTVQAGPYSRFITQADRGQGGVELWVNGVLERCPNQGHLLLLGDCNAKIGSVTSAAVSDLMPDVEDLAGECFRSLCDLCGLVVPSTFVEWHRGSSWTYSGPRGARSRLDYFAVDSGLAAHVVATCPCEELDLLHTHRDHRPLLLTLAWSFTPSDTALFKRKALYDRARARSASPSIAVDLFHHVPQVPWHADVNDHWDIVRSALQRTCKKWFPLPKRQQRQVYFQATTWQLLCDRKDVRQQLRGLQREQVSVRCRFALRWFHGVARRARGASPRLPCVVGDFALQLQLLDHEIAVNVDVLTSLAHRFRTQRKRDWHQWTHGQLDSRIQACRDVSCGELFRILQPKKAIAAKTGCSRRPLVGLRDSQGRWCSHPVAVAGAWQSHFGVEASLQHTWFLVPDGTSLQRPLTGSRPGDPNADLLFSFVMSRMLSQIHERLLSDGLIDDPVQAGGVLSHSTTWADDIAFLTLGTASDLMRRLEATASHVVDVLSEHGFGLSCGPGKTAALVEFAGKGSIQARQQMEARYDGQLRVFSEHVGVLAVPLVNKYKHLGGFVTRGASCYTDIQVRSAVALQRVRPLRKFLHHPQLPLPHKQLLVKSCGLSILTVHAGTWSGFNLKEFHAWQAAVTKLYALLHARDDSGAVPQLSHHHLAHHAQSPMALELVFIARLRLFFQLLAAGDICIRTAVLQNWEVVGATSWLAAVKTSLEWLRSQVGDRVLPVELETVHLPSSWDALQPQVRHLQKQLRVASRVHMMHLRSYVDFTEVNSALDSMMLDLGWLPPSPVSSPTPLDFTCVECGEAFSTATGLAVHQRHRHGQRSALRRFATDGACRHCGKYFHTRPRLLLHWQSPGNRCWVTIFRRYHPQSLEDSLLLDQRDCDRGVASHQQRLPPPELDRSWRWSTPAELAHGLPLRPVENVGEVTEDEFFQWSLLGALPPQWEETNPSSLTAPLPQPPNVLADLQSLERARFLRAGQWKVPFEPVPRPVARNAKYVLLFFSGHRRADDIAAWLHRLGDVQPLCVDTAIDETLGNVFQSELWVRLIRSRLVLAGHGGPPCETYSVARWVPCPDLEEKAPRPLRDDLFPWGLPMRSISEVQQCMVGNLLMFRTIYLLALIHLWGGAITLEHPQGTPVGDPRWGIWRSSFVKLLTQDPEVRTTSFLQGPLGREFAKPTVLLHGRLPWLPTLLFNAYLPGWRPTRVLVGRRGDRWATHEAKAYPGRLCRILAESYLRFGAAVSRTGDGVDPPDMAKVTAVLGAMWDPYLMDTVCTEMRADYQPRVIVSSGAYSVG
eukprot:Skav204405  [mRNA]  locus=scaffold4169:218344:224337:+ [translate_table: standard]